MREIGRRLTVGLGFRLAVGEVAAQVVDAGDAPGSPVGMELRTGSRR
jgi:hypothetical protein